MSYVLIALNRIRNMSYATCELNALNTCSYSSVNVYIDHLKSLKKLPLSLSKKNKTVVTY